MADKEEEGAFWDREDKPRYHALVEAAKSEIKEVNTTQLNTMLDDDSPLTIVDIREESEVAFGFFEGSIHISKGVIEREFESLCLDDSHRVILYCARGMRSALVAKSLQEMGWNNIHSLSDGWEGIQDKMAEQTVLN